MIGWCVQLICLFVCFVGCLFVCCLFGAGQWLIARLWGGEVGSCVYLIAPLFGAVDSAAGTLTTIHAGILCLNFIETSLFHSTIGNGQKCLTIPKSNSMFGVCFDNTATGMCSVRCMAGGDVSYYQVYMI